MLKTLALTLAVALMMASGFGLTPPGAEVATASADMSAPQISNAALKTSRLDLLHS